MLRLRNKWLYIASQYETHRIQFPENKEAVFKDMYGAFRIRELAVTQLTLDDLDEKMLTSISSRLHVCFDKGPEGSPTYDKSGFELDWEKVAHWMEPKRYNKAKIIRGMDRAVEKAQSDAKLMAEIFFEKGEAPESSKYGDGKNYWKDRVSKDLNVPWHKVGVEHFKEWEKKGFKKARRGEYENPSEVERKRMLRLMSGASLRK